MNSTLIEKVKDFLYIGKYKDKEEQGFGIIRVYPYICPENLEKTKERAICESRHLHEYRYVINVRSREAVEDITAALSREDYSFRVGKNSLSNIIRQWFSLDESPLSYISKTSEIPIYVKIEEESLETFIKLIQSLRDLKYYRNIYQTENDVFQII